MTDEPGTEALSLSSDCDDDRTGYEALALSHSGDETSCEALALSHSGDETSCEALALSTIRDLLRSSVAPPALPAVLTASGTGRERSPFDSTRTARWSVGSMSLLPPQPPAVLADAALLSPRAPGVVGGSAVSSRHEAARGGRAPDHSARQWD
jgi:hypothetical protein